MMTLASPLGTFWRYGAPLCPTEKPYRRAGVAVPRAQGHTGSGATHQNAAAPGSQPQGIYYGSSPPQSPQFYQPRPEQQYYQPQYPSMPYQTASTTSQGFQPGYSFYTTPPAYQPATQYPPQQSYPSGSASGASDLPRINPGRNHINLVRLMGNIARPEQRGRCTYAVIQVPYATKEGSQEFLVEAWDADGASLLGLHGLQVLLDGRLAVDGTAGGIKVVANRIQLVDQALPPSGYRGSMAAGEGSPGAMKTREPALDSKQVWKTHYSSSTTRTLKALAAHYGVQPGTIGKLLLPYAFHTKSPLHWSLLAEEAGLGPNDEVRLLDFMELVTQYKDEFTAMYGAAKEGAMPPPLPATKDGLLKVKPIRDWALAKPETDPQHYIVKTYESKYGMSKLYEALRMGVIAEATQGVWNVDAELGQH